MKLTTQKVPDEFIKSIPRGFTLVKKQGQDFLLIESLFCPNGHDLIVNSVRIHDEPSVKFKITVNGESGLVFVDAFWGSHAKLFSFLPRISGNEPAFAEAFCPYCEVSMMEDYACVQQGCGSRRGLLLTLPGSKNMIHVCSRLGCPGHVLDINDLPCDLIETVNTINYFGAGSEDILGRI
jgi:hypothetical protein